MGENSIAIGTYAGYLEQGTQSVAVGSYAGYTGQGQQSVAVGYKSAYSLQGTGSVAFGYFAGYTGQGLNAIAIGNMAGYTGQASETISMGTDSNALGSYGIAIGYNARAQYQSIAIGYEASSGSYTGCIVLSAGPTATLPTADNQLVMSLAPDTTSSEGVPTLAATTPGTTSGPNAWLPIQLSDGLYYLPIWKS
jgi:hypothetical protein